MINTERITEAIKEVAQEDSLQESWGDIVDVTEFMTDVPGFFSGASIGAFTQIYDRADGRYRPVYTNESDLKIIRAMAWLLVERVPMAQAWINRLLDYTIGTGFDWTIRHDSPEPQKAVRSFVREFLDDSKWSSELERESYAREVSDGEFLGEIVFENRQAFIVTREPDELTEPYGKRELEDWLELEFVPSWTFGVLSRINRPEVPYGYHFVHDSTGSDWDFVKAENVMHWKRNVRSRAKRGFSDFYKPHLYLLRADRVLTNTAEGAATQAAIAYIVEHSAAGTQSKAESIVNKFSYSANRVDPLTGLIDRRRKMKPGTRLDVPAGQLYKAGLLGSNNSQIYIQVLESALRLAGSVHAFPEGMLTGSYQNANFASSLTAEAPFVQGRIAEQNQRAERMREMIVKAVRVAAERGVLRSVGISSWDDLRFGMSVEITPSKVVPRNVDELTQSLAIQKANGWVSDKTAITELGRDVDAEVANGLKLGGDAGNPASGDPGAEAGAEQAGAADSPSWLGLNRIEWQRVRKNVVEVLSDYATGKTKKSVAKMLLGALGIPPSGVQTLLLDIQDGQLDSLPPENTGQQSESARDEGRSRAMAFHSIQLLEAFCATGKGGKIDNSCSSKDPGVAKVNDVKIQRMQQAISSVEFTDEQLSFDHWPGEGEDDGFSTFDDPYDFDPDTLPTGELKRKYADDLEQAIMAEVQEAPEPTQHDLAIAARLKNPELIADMVALARSDSADGEWRPELLNNFLKRMQEDPDISRLRGSAFAQVVMTNAAKHFANAPDKAKYLEPIEKVFSKCISREEDHREQAQEHLADAMLDEARDNFNTVPFNRKWLWDHGEEIEANLSPSQNSDAVGKWGRDEDENYVMHFETSSGSRFKIFTQTDSNLFRGQSAYDVSFYDDKTDFHVTGKQGTKTAIEVFKTVTAATGALLKEDEPQVMKFSAAEKNRAELYDRLARQAAAANPDYKAYSYQDWGNGGKTYFLLVRRDHDENFRKLAHEYDDVDFETAKTVVESEMLEAFCPTGKKGGRDNSCSSRKGGRKAKPSKPARKVRRGLVIDAQKQKDATKKPAATLVDWSPNWKQSVTPSEFIAARNNSTRAGYLSPLVEEDISKHALILSGDGKVGAAVSPEGDIQNVFNNGGPKGAGADAMLQAMRRGGKMLDCYDGFLPAFYTKFGFEETNRMKFNREYALPSWDFEKIGEPDVVFMALRGQYTTNQIKERLKDGEIQSKRNEEYTDDWDGAKAKSASVGTARRMVEAEGRTALLDANGSREESLDRTSGSAGGALSDCKSRC